MVVYYNTPLEYKPRFNKIILVVISTLFALFLSCSKGDTAGTISETESGAMGHIIMPDGSVAEGVQVIAYRSTNDTAIAEDTVVSTPLPTSLLVPTVYLHKLCTTVAYTRVLVNLFLLIQLIEVTP